MLILKEIKNILNTAKNFKCETILNSEGTIEKIMKTIIANEYNSYTSKTENSAIIHEIVLATVKNRLGYNIDADLFYINYLLKLQEYDFNKLLYETLHVAITTLEVLNDNNILDFELTLEELEGFNNMYNNIIELEV